MGAGFDRFITLLQRLWHAFKMGLLISFVALGAAAVWFLVNAPDSARARALAEALRTGPVPVNSLAPEGWTHLCLGAVGTELREVFRAQTPHGHRHCAGWNGPLALYGSFAPMGFTGPEGCDVIAVQREIFTPLPPGAAPMCTARFGLVHLEASATQPPYLIVSRR